MQRTDPGWCQPQQPLAPTLWCGTSLAAQTTPGYGSDNLALHVGDAPQQVQANRQRLQRNVEVEAGRQVQAVAWLDQVHGARVVEACVDNAELAPSADAFWTTKPGLALAVLTADCLPVVLVAQDGSCVGIAHAGWRGLVQGVLQNLVAAMPAAPETLVAWGGPCIGPAAYEVGLDVVTAVATLPGSAQALTPGITQDKRQLGLQVLAEGLLRSVGVSSYQASARCAFADQRCYSHRRDGGVGPTGRMATVAMLTGNEPSADAGAG